MLKIFEVYNPSSGYSLGLFEAETEEGALEACCREAGYETEAEACKATGAGPGILRALEVKRTTRRFRLPAGQSVVLLADWDRVGGSIKVDGHQAPFTLRDFELDTRAALVWGVVYLGYVGTLREAEGLVDDMIEEG